MRRLSVLLLLLVSAGCNKELTDPPTPAEATVIATPNSTFLPPSATIRTGGQITWVFQSLAHSVIFESSTGAPSNIQEPVSATTEERTFSTAGVYAYHCGVHPQMTGTINVVAP